jgi:predicted ATP-dependent endonuclease of OLD family
MVIIMRIKSINIQKYKSIEEVNIPFDSYGKGKNKSSVAFLVGLNESGKSSILEAINFLREGFAAEDFIENYYKGAEEDGYIWIAATLELENPEFYREKVSELLSLNKEFTSKIVFERVRKITYQSQKSSGSFYSVVINNDLPFYKYIVVSNPEKKIQELKSFNGVEEEINAKNAKTFLSEGQTLLTKKDLEELIRSKLEKIFNYNLPIIQVWKPKSEYLINEVIDLNEFKDDTSISVPLQNIFHVAGFDNDEKIKKAIEKAIARSEYKAELQITLSKSITSYVNKIWKEHKINIKVNIDAANCNVYVEDKDKEHKYFMMKQRSDGFNQFCSLILSLSTSNDTKSLENTIILLDEPEIHLHPSGVRYMRDEILKIGKNNIVFVSTHSHYMVDTTTPERHFIVSRKEMSTEVKQIDEYTSMNDDQVLASAFGISLFKELLPENIIVVEGADDKLILHHSLDLLYKDFFYSIKSAGGASKVYGIASMLADEEVAAFFVLDDDKEGRDEKRNILQNLRNVHDKNHVLTIRDISPNVIEKSTLEDLLPVDFVKNFFEEEMNQSFDINTELPILTQIKNQNESLKKHKEQMNAKKYLLAERFISIYKTKGKLEADAPNLVEMINTLVQKIRAI